MKILVFILVFILFQVKIISQENNCETDSLVRLIETLDLSGTNDEFVLSLLDSAFQVIEKENLSVLESIVELGKRSDGYVSSYLGFGFGSLLINEFDKYVELISQLNEKDQELIGRFAFYMDGGGMNIEDYDKVEIKLEKLNKSNSQLMSQLAKIHLKLLQKIKSESLE